MAWCLSNLIDMQVFLSRAPEAADMTERLYASLAAEEAECGT